jgi:hypothetical protein
MGLLFVFFFFCFFFFFFFLRASTDIEPVSSVFSRPRFDITAGGVARARASEDSPLLFEKIILPNA